MSTSLTSEQRYVAKLVFGPDGSRGCIGWSAKVDKYGNAKFTYTVGERHIDTGAHRFGWELTHDFIPEGYKLSNTCGFKACQNMDHWVLVSRNLDRTPADLYRSKFTVLGPDDCWPWQEQSRDRDGYGLMSWREDEKTVTARAHRFGWDFANPDDQLVAGEIVCHTCDNPPCQNPTHWFKGTHQDNSDDMVFKKRQRAPRGIDHYNAVINEDLVRLIRRRYAEETISQQRLADSLGLKREVVRKVVARITWGWVL
jgi:hypothetical protein